jgi:polyribonucleotide nucleotidyltransferase
MGLIKEGDDYIVLTDIAGVEDHLGDMDFKVAGTEEGITALQMDIKITGVTFEILRDALAQAKDARLEILGKMKAVIDGPNAELSLYAPRILSTKIDTEKIGMIIGKGGETIRGLQEEFEAQIDISDDGTINVYSSSGAKGDALIERINAMTRDVALGDEFDGKVVKTTTFGAFVELIKGTDGLLHISNVSPGNRVDTVEEVLSQGDVIKVRVAELDRERGRVGLRLSDDPEIVGKTAEELKDLKKSGGPRGGGGDRPPRRDGDGGRPPRRDRDGDRPPRRDRDGGGEGSGDRPPRRRERSGGRD